MRRAPAPAKLNLALVVGPTRDDGQHEVATVLQRIDLADRIELDPSAERSPSTGFADDTLVRDALERARRRGRRRAALARRGSRSGSRSRPASAAAAPTPRPRSGSRTRRSPSRSPPERLHELARGARRRRPVLPRPTARSSATGDGTDARAARPAAGLLRPAAPPATARRRRRPAPSTRLRRARRRRRLRRSAGRAPSTRSPACAGRATSRRCRRTTSRRSPLADELRGARRLPRRRQRRRPDRLRALPRPRRGRRGRGRALAARGRLWSRFRRGTVDRGDEPDARHDRARHDARRPLAARAAAADRALDRGRRGRRRGVRRPASRAGRSSSLAVLAVALYAVVGRNDPLGRRPPASWILAASQALAVVVVIRAWLSL